MNKFYRQKKLLIPLLGVVTLCFFVLSTDPQKLSAGLLLVPPVLLFIVVFALADALIGTYMEVPAAKQRLVSGAVATAPVLLLSLASLGQLTSKDTLLSLLLVGGLAAYFSRAALTHGTGSS